MEEEDIDSYLRMEAALHEEEPDWVEMEATEQPGIAPQEPVPQIASEVVVPPPPVFKSLTESRTVPVAKATIDPPRLTAPKTISFDPDTLPNKRKDPKSFALAMQAERERALGGGSVGSDGMPSKPGSIASKLMQLDAESEIHTLKPLYQRCRDAAQYLHSRPPGSAELVASMSDGADPHSGSSAFVTIVLADGTKSYLYKRRTGVASAPKTISGAASALSSPAGPASSRRTNAIAGTTMSPSPKCLLSKPMAELMQEADALKVKALLLKDALLAERAERSAPPPLFQTESEADVSVASGDGSLWVDKYAPRSFTQLLSPEKINREVLKALKKWDRFVFKTDNHTAGDEANSAGTGTGAGAGVGGGSKAKSAATLGATTAPAGSAGDHNSEDCRPKNKVILLCGPPGTGKTTLAHVVAKHCGYTPIEINASDDRSPEKLREQIARATQNTTLTADARPNCMILDEIDGMDGSRDAAQALIDIVKAPLKGGAASGGKASKAAAGTFALTRPLICICNDQYAPALRELVRLADVFVFSAPQDVRLVQRLRQVCKQEGLHVGNSAAIAELCTATGHDIRASINNLQFAALKSSKQQHQQQLMMSTGAGKTGTTAAHGGGGGVLDIGTVLQGMIRSGLKDDSLDLGQIWRQMFTLASPTTTAPTAAAAHGSSVEETALEMASTAAAAAKAHRVDHSMRAMDAMLSYGDHQQVIAGIFENVHSMEALDPNMSKHTLIAEWLSHSEELNSFMPRARDGFQLMPYVSAIAGAVYCHMAVAAARRPKIEWPRKDKEAHFRGVQRDNILQSFCDGLNIHTLRSSKQRVVLDVLPHLIDVISPPPSVRALPFITLPVPEQLAIQDTVKVMESCGLSYMTSKTFDTEHRNKFGKDGAQAFNPYHQNTTVLVLDPAVDQLLNYGECEELAQRHPVVSQEMRQLLHTEQRKLSIQLKAHKLGQESDGDAMDVVQSTQAPTSASKPSASTASSAASATEASTPYLIMQQQQRDSALSKRQHSGVLGSFFTKSAAQPAKKAKPDAASGPESAEKKPAFNANSVRFKFNQGFSNAVKRPVLMDEFL